MVEEHKRNPPRLGIVTTIVEETSGSSATSSAHVATAAATATAWLSQKFVHVAIQVLREKAGPVRIVLNLGRIEKLFQAILRDGKTIIVEDHSSIRATQFTSRHSSANCSHSQPPC